ncbi:MAG: endonuclease Q family protein, partial [Treponema sp.]|nr:endonuclease Q family protein [Treponema sp.]
MVRGKYYELIVLCSMRIIADLHIHSHYSRATSPRLTVPYLDRWARIKGISLVGTGDCTHPGWLSELRENLDNAEDGLFTLKNSMREAFDSGPAMAEELPRPGLFLPGGKDGETAGNEQNAKVRFVLSGEISTIYKRDGKTRKVHHVVLLPDFKAAALFNTKLERIGNIRSDSRPILGIDSRDLFSMLL